MRWRDAPPGYGPHKTLENRVVRWSRMSVFDRIFALPAGGAGTPDRPIADATHLKAHRTAAGLLGRAMASCNHRERSDDPHHHRL